MIIIIIYTRKIIIIIQRIKILHLVTEMIHLLFNLGAYILKKQETGKTWQNMITKGKRFIQYLGYERERLSSWQWMIIAIWNGIACWGERGGATIERSTMSHCLWPLPAKPLCVWKNPVPIICLYTTHSILLANVIFPVSWQSQLFCFVCLFVRSSPKWTTAFCLFCKF